MEVRKGLRPVAIEGDEAGFTPIFDGKTLDGWEGDSTYWRVENGSLVGEITPETVIRSNTFIVWRGGRPRDFELKLDYRITPKGNSGINYRSALVPDEGRVVEQALVIECAQRFESSPTGASC